MAQNKGNQTDASVFEMVFSVAVRTILTSNVVFGRLQIHHLKLTTPLPTATKNDISILIFPHDAFTQKKHLWICSQE